MDFDKLTIKSQEALQSAIALTQEFSQQEVKNSHFLVSILNDSSGFIYILFEELKANISAITKEQ